MQSSGGQHTVWSCCDKVKIPNGLSAADSNSDCGCVKWGTGDCSEGFALVRVVPCQFRAVFLKEAGLTKLHVSWGDCRSVAEKQRVGEMRVFVFSR